MKKNSTKNDNLLGVMGFFTNFKTGEIGLKSLSGKGFYQAKVTEEMLRNKGFEKLG